MTPAEVIRKVFKRDGMKSVKAIARTTGINYDQLRRVRMKDPGSIRLRELWLMQKYAYFTDEELLQIIKERGNA